ncbi:hypothetical protein HJFPF1_04755 [Paramyrothecium foliicola]|nr:hypothetical protein HJFPF1_04755 [Paramyrothecium foliicola]
MASVTRSTRRAEGLHPHHVNTNSPVARPRPSGLYHQDSRSKRALDVAERDFEAINPKKTRIAVEIFARPSHQSSSSPIPSENVKFAPPKPRPVVATVPPQQQPAPTLTPTPTPAPIPAATQAPTPQQQQKQPPQQPQPVPSALQWQRPTPAQAANLTKHQVKVINGIRHELDRLQPQPDDTKERGRKLRSQEATRFKSELSAYFPDYDEVIGNEPKEQHLLNADTPIVLVDSGHRRMAPQPAAQQAVSQATVTTPNHDVDEYPVRGYGDALFSDVYDAQRIDFGFLEAQYKNKTLGDPLPDNLFEPVHKRAERLERSIRNTEKGRAQHEKDQIIRLLDGLQGHDWLRLMGVNGITETRKKSFEPARDYFIKGCQAILDKFRNWSLEEKRRKLEKEKAIAEEASEASSSEEGSNDDQDQDDEGEDGDEGGANEEAASRDDTSDVSSPAKQLREEALARSKLAARSSKKLSAARPKTIKPPKPPEPPREFKSFYSKRHERESALNRHRRAGRKVLAWGHPIPDIPEADFELPEEYRDADTLKTRARQKRRERRNHRT